jgi:ABC-type bacteriocin/lantibiotic exporter with double-glycine peptidase domain
MHRLWLNISPQRRLQFGILLLLMVIASFAEVLSIGAVLPFLGVLTSPEVVFVHPYSQPFIQMLGISSSNQMLLPLTIAFAAAAVVAGVARLLLLWASNRLAFATGSDLSNSIYRRTLYQPYAVHISRNSSAIINGISNKTGTVINTLMMFLGLVASGVMLISILIALLSVDPYTALAAFGGFGSIYCLIILATRKQLSTNSELIALESTKVIKSLQEGLGGIRDVLIDGNQEVYCQIYRNADFPLRLAQGSSAFISTSPRYAMEALGMVLISVLAYALSQQADGVAKAIPVLGALALGAQRLLPILQQGYAAWTSIKGGQASLQDALELLDQPMPEKTNQSDCIRLPFARQINLKKISYRYDSHAPWILKDLNIEIAKGSRVGIIGSTGSGKSTLLDIIMGLLLPNEGVIEVDGLAIDVSNYRAWQALIAHVPQAIYLADSSITENIAFGVPIEQIDIKRVIQAARKAQVADVIDALPKKYETLVGERGIRLSGGQRQRIGIARALYKQAEVIIFDEATSALDHETELAVMQAIETLGDEITVLIIAHRLTTLKACTRIIELSKGEIIRSGSYSNIVGLQNLISKI